MENYEADKSKKEKANSTSKYMPHWMSTILQNSSSQIFAIGTAT
jgi:hypothetical protein